METIERTSRLTSAYLANPKLWITLFCVTMVCVLSGPFDTLKTMSGSFRLIFWGLIVVLTGISGLWAAVFITVKGWRRFHQILMVGVLFGVCVSTIVVLISYALLNSMQRFSGTLELISYSFPSSPIVFVSIFYLVFNRDNISEISADVRPALFARLKKFPHAKSILSLKAQDHYVEVTTELGSELCLLRLADAISEVTPIEGLQVHRSNWVAKSAIKSLNFHGPIRQVQLTNDNTLSVSQARIKDIEETLRNSSTRF